MNPGQRHHADSPTPTPIHAAQKTIAEIQGTAAASPLTGQAPASGCAAVKETAGVLAGGAAGKEPYEGMLVKPRGSCTITNVQRDHYGQIGPAFDDQQAFADQQAKIVSAINGSQADESIVMQYSRRRYNIVDFYTTQPYTACDHDPALVGIRVK